jgi:hypothetical protein
MLTNMQTIAENTNVSKCLPHLMTWESRQTDSREGADILVTLAFKSKCGKPDLTGANLSVGENSITLESRSM